MTQSDPSVSIVTDSGQLGQEDGKRFKMLTNDEIEREMLESSPVTTRKKADWSMNVFTTWHQAKKAAWATGGASSAVNTGKSYEEMGKADLNYLMKYFVFEVRNTDGDRYSASTLKDMFSMVQYYFQHTLKKDWSLWKEPAFVESRRALDAAMKLATKDGKGAGLRRSEAIPDSLENRAWNSELFELSTPRGLSNAIVWLVGKHFALRGGSELRNLLFEQKIRLDLIDGNECLSYVDNAVTKTHQGGLKGLRRDPKVVRAFHSAGHDRCIVCIYTAYVAERPDGCDNALFLSPNRNWTPGKTGGWFTKGPIGRHTLATLVSTAIATVAPEDSGRYTNQSLRKTCATRLHEAEIERADICRITGHSSSAVDRYIGMSVGMQRRTCAIIGGDSSAGLRIAKGQAAPSDAQVCDARHLALMAPDAQQLTLVTPHPDAQQEAPMAPDAHQVACVSVTQPANKKMRIEADGDKNKVVIYFD